VKADGVLCYFCGEAIGALEPLSRRVAGWEPVRGGKGGGNALADRVELNHYAHTHCAKRAGDRRRRGISQSQGAML
jgi:hypothetical protein